MSESPPHQLIKYDAACRAIAEAHNSREVLDIRADAEGRRAAARAAKNREGEIYMAEIRIRAERRLGEIIKAQKETVGLNKGRAGKGRPRLGGSEGEPPKDNKPTLDDAEIGKKLSSRAQKLAAVPEDKFEGMIGDWRERVQKENERVTSNLLREGERSQKREWKAPPVPKDRYQLIYADPPWRYEHSKTESRAIENQYPTMSLEEIKAMEVPAAEDSVLFLWATSPKLAEALSVMAAWGFTYRTCAVWDKEKIGMGYYFRQQHELLLLGTRGTPRAPIESVRKSSVYREKRGKHSSKPTHFYELIESMYPDMKKIELFCRESRKGWAAWGNQVAV